MAASSPNEKLAAVNPTTETGGKWKFTANATVDMND